MTLTPRQQAEIRRRLDEKWEQIARIVGSRRRGQRTQAHVRPTVPQQLFIDMAERIARSNLISKSRLRAVKQQIKQQRKKLNSLSSGLSEIIRKIKRLGPLLNHEPEVLYGRGRIEWLTDFRNAVNRCKLLTPQPGSGGARVHRRYGERQEQAAYSAYFILRRPDVNIEPDLNLTGPYIELSEIMIYVATGRQPEMFHACREVLNWYEELGHPEPAIIMITRRQPQ